MSDASDLVAQDLRELRQLVVAVGRADPMTVRSLSAHLRERGLPRSGKSSSALLLAGELAPTVEELAALFSHADLVSVAQGAARLAGGTFVQPSEPGQDGALCAALRVGADVGELQAAVATAKRDGRIDAAELEALEAHIDQAIDRLSQLRARLRLVSREAR